jgi:hypothetical protein
MLVVTAVVASYPTGDKVEYECLVATQAGQHGNYNGRERR